MRFAAVTAIAASALLVLAACGDDDGGGNAAPADIDPADFSATVDNPLFPLSTFTTQVYEGEETDPDTGETIETRVEITVLDETKTIAGVEVTVVRDEAFEDGELVESTLDYFAQHADGSVYYFGEDVDNYEDGELKDHDGSWIAGEGEARPGVIMPPAPAVGDVFEQEQAPGIAEDRMTVLSVDESVTVPAGSFEGCIETEDVNPLDAGAVEHKFYCPGVGFVKEEFEEGALELVSSE
jgi:hypothetical protein